MDISSKMKGKRYKTIKHVCIMYVLEFFILD